MKRISIIILLISFGILTYGQKLNTPKNELQGTLILNEVISDNTIVGYMPSSVEDWKKIVSKEPVIKDIKIQKVYLKTDTFTLQLPSIINISSIVMDSIRVELKELE